MCGENLSQIFWIAEMATHSSLCQHFHRSDTWWIRRRRVFLWGRLKVRGEIIWAGLEHILTNIFSFPSTQCFASVQLSPSLYCLQILYMLLWLHSTCIGTEISCHYFFLLIENITPIIPRLPSIPSSPNYKETLQVDLDLAAFDSLPYLLSLLQCYALCRGQLESNYPFSLSYNNLVIMLQ